MTVTEKISGHSDQARWHCLEKGGARFVVQLVLGIACRFAALPLAAVVISVKGPVFANVAAADMINLPNTYTTKFSFPPE